MLRLRAALLLALLGWAPVAAAATDQLDVDLRIHVPVVLGSLALSSRMGGTPHAAACAGCEQAVGLDEDAREALRLRDPLFGQYARRGSDLLAGAVIPAGVLAVSALGAWQDGSPRELVEDAVVILEAATLAANLTSLSKRSFARTRPDGGGGSFFSAHTSRAFVLATAAGSVATLRGRGSAPWVWAGGLTLATGVAYLRVAGDAHWLTDVAAGAAVGTAVGVAVPWLLHRRGHGLARRVSPSPGGIRIVF